ncbi:DUF6090 family protein [Polaribacter sp.]|uniref:DUF6090 family protein n=1 Tax=Polaribacter sp. TaxID=1920175 RepID=UPI004048C397
MIKIFRKIRQNLLIENKTSKYFKYAIGEIVLVVIGILIALQINNWNEQKKLIYKEQQALTEIVSDLDAIIFRLEEMKSTGKNNINNNLKSLNIIINHLDSVKPYQDSLKVHFDNCFTYPNPLFKTSGYETLSSMGMDIILDTKVRSEIGLFFTKSKVSVDGQYREVRDDFYNYMLDYLRKDFRYDENKLKPKNYEMLQKNGDFLQSIIVFEKVYQEYLKSTNKALKDANALKNLINTYIKKRN